MVTWVATIDGSEFDTVYDVEVQDTFNPFGDYAISKFDDESGTLFEQVSRGTPIELTVDPDENSDLSVASGDTKTVSSGTTETFNTVQNSGTVETAGTLQSQNETFTRFDGYAVEVRELDQQGADALEIEAYTLDQFLRRNQVSNDQSGKALVDALEDIIKTDTPVSWNAANVSVGDPQDLTRSFRGVPVERALRDLSFKSENEEFGVNSNNEFFFRERETEHIDRGVDNTQWFNYDIPELGKETINEVEVWYEDGEESVIVDNGDDKLDLQDSLSLPEPGTQRAEINRPQLTDLADAEDAGRQYLQFRNATLTGTVTTFGLYDAAPGDTINVTIDPRGIDSEFAIAAVNYKWGVDETELTIVENKGNDNSEVLFRLTEAVDRIEMQDANRDAPSNRITTTDATAEVSVSVTADVANTDQLTIQSGETQTVNSGETQTASTVSNAGTLANQGTFETQDSGTTTTADGTRFVNPGRNSVRDGWAGDGNPQVSNIVVGDNGSNLSRSNTALQAQTDSASVSESLPDSTSVEYTATVSQTGVRELGVTETDGTLLTRAVFDAAIDIGGSVSVTLAVSDNTESSRSVLTADGQTAVRDVIADNSPDIPDEYAYGTGTTAVSESDTSLDSEVVSQDLTDVLLERYALSDDFATFVEPIADDEPLEFNANGELTMLQTTQFQEAEDNPGDGTVVGTNLPGDYSSFDAVELDAQGDQTSFTFRFDYRVPSGELTVDFYAGFDNFDGTLQVRVNGEDYTSVTFSGNTVNNGFNGGGFIDTEFAERETITVEFELTNLSSGRALLDTVHAYDTLNRFSDLDTDRSGTIDTSGTGNIATAPDLYPKVTEVDVETINTRREFDEARADSTFNNTKQNQFIELSNDGSTFVRTNNSETASATFSSPSKQLFSRFGISHYEEVAVESPRFDASQTVDLFELFANVDATVGDGIGEALTRAIIPPGTVTGKIITEAGAFGNNNLLTRHRLAEFEVLADQQLISSEITRFSGD